MPHESTTPDLEERTRKLIEANNRRDFDAVTAMYAPDAVFEARSGIFEGRDAIRGFFEEWWGTYEDYEVALEEFRYVGNGVTYVVYLQRGRLAGSGGFVRDRVATVWCWAEGRVERITNYTDIDEGRAAAERLAEERG